MHSLPDYWARTRPLLGLDADSKTKRDIYLFLANNETNDDSHYPFPSTLHVLYVSIASSPRSSLDHSWQLLQRNSQGQSLAAADPTSRDLKDDP